MATHSSILAWKILWTEKPGRLQSVGFLGGGHNWATSLSLFTFMHWRRKWQPTPVFLLENPRDGGAWWAAIYGVTQSRKRLKRLSSSSSSNNNSILTSVRGDQVRSWLSSPVNRSPLSYNRGKKGTWTSTSTWQEQGTSPTFPAEAVWIKSAKTEGSHKPRPHNTIAHTFRFQPKIIWPTKNQEDLKLN